ncbi:MAG: hypothetical protein FWH20_08655, partial [Oscillospiraceae bacterium]|nr:hypothetical protein [Oscillospiraceae bacterium]
MKHTFCLILTAVVLITAVLSGCGANRELEEEMARLKAELEALQEGLATAEVTLEDTGEEFASEEIQEHGEETEPESDTEKEIRQILTEIDLALSVDNYASAEEGIEKVTEIAESAGINLENITFDNGTAQ